MTIAASPGPQWLWLHPFQDSANVLSLNASAIDAADEGLAVICTIPKSGNVKKLLFATRTTTTGATVDVRVETLDETVNPAIPSGTLYHANAVTTLAIANGDDNVGLVATFATAFPATQGAMVALLVKQPNTSFGNLQLATFDEVADALPYVLHNTGVSPAVSWALVARGPVVGLEYDDGSYAPIVGSTPITAVTATTFNNTSTPDVIGNKFRLAYPVRASHWWIWGDMDGDYVVKLYGADGVTVIASSTCDKDTRRSAAYGFIAKPFDATVDLSASTYYYLAVEPSSATSVIINDLTVLSAAAMDAFPLGQDYHYVSAKDPSGTGSWTAVTTRRVFLGLGCSGFDAGGGGATPYVIGS